MSKVVLDDVISGFGLSKINENFQKIQDELNDKVLYRDNPDGETNTLEQDVDVNGFSLYNVDKINGVTVDTLTESVDTVVDNMQNIDIVANNIDNVNLVAVVDTDITAVAAVAEDVATLAPYAPDVAAYTSGIYNNLAAEDGASLIGVISSATGSVQRTLDEKIDDFIKSSNDFGLVGNGIADDHLAIESALESGRIEFLAGDYNLAGNTIDIANSVFIKLNPGVIFRNGWIRIRPTDASKKVHIIGDFVMIDGSVRIASVADVSHTDQFSPDQNSLIVNCDNIYVENIFSGSTQAIDIWGIKDSKIGVLNVRGASGITASQAILLQDIYDSSIAGVDVDGEYSMGCHIDSSSTRPAYSVCRSSIGFVKVKKPTAFADYSGHHGVYFHAAYRSSIGFVQGIGWGDTVSSSADFKFRDNDNCYVGGASVGRMRFTADNNYSYFTQISKSNHIKNLDCSISLSMVATSPGYNLNNVIENISTPVISADSNQATQRGFIFTGTCSIGVAASGDDINTYGITFEDADVTLTTSPDLVGNFLTARRTVFRSSLSVMPTTASTTTFEDVIINGDFTHNGGSAAHSFPWIRTHVTGTISIAGSGASRTTTANWRYVSSDAAEIVGTTFRPETKKYRYVAFSDTVYDSVG